MWWRRCAFEEKGSCEFQACAGAYRSGRLDFASSRLHVPHLRSCRTGLALWGEAAARLTCRLGKTK